MNIQPLCKVHKSCSSGQPIPILQCPVCKKIRKHGSWVILEDAGQLIQLTRAIEQGEIKIKSFRCDDHRDWEGA